MLESTTDTEAAITELRRQKVESKFYHVKSKLLPKQMKKVKVFLTQRIVKKIKQRKSEGDEDVKKLESELVRVKGLDHVKLANWAFSSRVLKDDEYLQVKMVELGIVEKEVDFEFEGLDKVLSIKCFQDAVKTFRDELTIFLKKLLHELVAEPLKKAAPVVKSKVLKRPSSDKSFFMDSLMESESDDRECGIYSEDDNGIYSDDENGFYNEADYVDSDNFGEKPKKKKNRLGQLARRRLAEKLFGQEAKHIKSGGLTVQQREQERKQKSLQKKERAARIKKDAIKSEKFKREKSADESVSEFKKAATIKIDPKMHPSWAAKLQQQAKAQQATFQGQKIKFDE